MKIRPANPSDHPAINHALNDWWNKSDMSCMVPRSFLIHFCDTTFVAQTRDRITGFLTGFFSQTIPDQGYIHLAGVHPKFRKKGIGSTLYQRFFQKCLENDRSIVQACAAIDNSAAIAFHARLGFDILEGTGTIDGIDVSNSYNHPGDTMVLFKKKLISKQQAADLEIRQAGVNDIKLLSGIIRKSYQDVAARFKLTRENCPRHPSNCQDSWIERDFIRGTAYYILLKDNIPLGCAAIEQASRDTCYLERLCILPQYRKNGYGGQLVTFIFDRARALKARILSIGIIAGQKELKAWYETFGFIEEQTKTVSHLPFKVTIMMALVEPVSTDLPE